MNRIYTFVAIALVVVFTSVTAAEIEMKTHPTDEKDFPEYIQYLVDVSFPRTAEERALDAEVQARYQDAHNIDSIFIAAPGFPPGFTFEQYEEFMDHMRRNNFTAVSTTLSNGSDKSVQEAFDRIKELNKYIKDNSDKYLQIKSLADFDKAKEQGKIGVYYNFQSMNSLGEDVGNIEKYYKLVFAP